jgi:uncharacterized RDD family membrane protein YckC
MAATIDTAVLGLILIGLATVGSLCVIVVSAVVPPADQDRYIMAALGPVALTVLVTEVLAAWLYSSALHSSRWQATIGKRMLGLGVTDSEGRPITFTRASARHLATTLVWLSFGLGFALIVLPWRQGAHDLVARTSVLQRHGVVGGRAMSPTGVGPQAARERPHLTRPDSGMPIRLRLPTPAWWVRILALLWFVVGLVFVALALTGESDTPAFGVSPSGCWW